MTIPQFPAPGTYIGDCTNLTGGPLVPNLVVADPHVMFDYTTLKFHAWFTACDSQNKAGIGYATSTNGYEWSVWKKSSRPDPLIDLVVKPTTWDAPGIETAHVCKGPDNIWRMYYTGNKANPLHHFAIGLATSNNGVAWTKRTSPILTPTLAWEKNSDLAEWQGVLEPSVLWDPTINQYRMWYAALGSLDGVHTYRMGHATSPNGITWTKTSTPLLSPQTGTQEWDNLWVSHMHVIADPVKGFHLFYHASKDTDYVEGAVIQKGKFGHAYSTDGLTWERNPANPILSPQEWSIIGPSVLPLGDGLMMWYSEFERFDSLVCKIKLAEFAS